MGYFFSADRTLGKLAKWLRILGFDTCYESGGRSLFEMLENERILLTRIKNLQHMSCDNRIIFIKSNCPEDQLKQVIKEVGITIEDLRPFSRCTLCNLQIVDIHKDSVIGRVPDYIWETHHAFSHCPRCEKIYWSGSHAKRSMERIEALFQNTGNTKSY